MATNTRATTHTATSTIPRNTHVRMIHAWLEHLHANPNAEVFDGLSTLILHVQGDADQMDDAHRELLRALTSDAVANYDSLPATPRVARAAAKRVPRSASRGRAPDPVR